MHLGKNNLIWLSKLYAFNFYMLLYTNTALYSFISALFTDNRIAVNNDFVDLLHGLERACIM